MGERLRWFKVAGCLEKETQVVPFAKIKKLWTPADDRVLVECAQSSVSRERVAARLNRSGNAVKERAAKLGVTLKSLRGSRRQARNASARPSALIAKATDGAKWPS